MPENKPKKSESQSKEEQKDLKKTTGAKKEVQAPKAKKSVDTNPEKATKKSNTKKKNTDKTTVEKKQPEKKTKTQTKKELESDNIENEDKTAVQNEEVAKADTDTKADLKETPEEQKTEVEAAEQVFAQPEDEEIKEELENIKNIVQQEVDKILENPESSDWTELVKAARDEKMSAKKSILENNEYEVDDEDLCECCGENPKDTSVSEHNPYCTSCRESMKKYPFKFTEILMPLIVVALMFVASWQLAQTYATFNSVAKAESLVKQGKLYSAASEYETLTQNLHIDKKPVGRNIMLNQVELYGKIGFESYETTEKFIQTNFAGENFDSIFNRRVKKVKDQIDNFNLVYKAAGTIVQESKDYNDFIKRFDKYIKEDKENVYDKGLVEYWKYYAAIVFNQDTKVQLSHLKKMEEKSPIYDSVYLPALAEMYLNMGKFDEMFKYCDKMAQRNKEDLYSNIYKSIAYRLKGDLDKALNSATDGLKINPKDPDINHQLSIIYLLQNDSKTAIKYAKTAYENASSQFTYVTNANVYALCAHLNKDTEAYTTIEEELSQSGMGVAKDVIGIIEGTKTLQDVFLKGKGDIAWS